MIKQAALASSSPRRSKQASRQAAAQEGRVHPLKKRRDRFQKYVQELPFLGFYSGKYDLNRVKEFMFLVLAQEGVPFTIKRNHNFICFERALLRLHISVFLMSPTFCRLDSVATSFSMPKSVLKLKGSFHMNG